MKTVFVTIRGKAAPGDDVRLYYTTPKGGRTDVAHIANLESDNVAIAKDLAGKIELYWLEGAFQVVTRENMLIITTQHDDYIFKADYPVHRGDIELVVDDTRA